MSKRRKILDIVNLVFALVAVVWIFRILAYWGQHLLHGVSVERALYVFSTVVLAAALTAIFVGTGHLLLSLLGISPEYRLETVVISWGLGVAGVVMLLVLLCSFGCLLGEVLWLMMVVAAGTAFVGLRRMLNRFHRSARPTTVTDLPPADTRFWILVLAVPIVIWMLWGQCRGPDNDEMAYHLAVPKIYLAHHGFCYIPFNVYSNMPLATEMVSALCMGIQDVALVRLVLSEFAIASILMIVLIARGLFGDIRAGLIGAVLFYSNNILCYGPYTDLALTFWTLLGFHALMRWRDKRQTGWLLLSGMSAGMAMGTKYTGLFPAVMLALLLLWHQLVSRRKPEQKEESKQEAEEERAPARYRFVQGRAGPLVIWALTATAFVAPWLLKNLVFTGNPVYPMLYEIFGGPDWSPRLHRCLLGWHRMIGLGREPVDYMRLPWNISMHHAHQGYRYFAGFLNPMVLMFVPLALVFWLREKRFLYLLAAGVITMALWSLGSQQVRFLLPAYSLLALCAGLGAAKLMEWSRRQRIFFVRPAVWAAVLILVTSAWWRSVEQWPQVLLSIFETPSVMEVSAPRMCPQVPAMRFVNKHLPAYDTRIMLVDFNGGFILNHQYIFDSFYEASQVREMIAECGSPAVLQTMLESKRFTHVMRWPQIRGEGVQRFFATKEDEERFGKAEQILAAYLSRYCERVAEVEGTEIYRIRTELPGRPLPEGLAERWMPGWGTTGRRNW